tara:strand:- start:12337 stop:12621 length:285 start_codon:yes stop_codon:yes gene_type:complete
MLHGNVEPYRFNERVEGGKKTYDAITHIHYFGTWAFAVGLTDTLNPSHAQELKEALHGNGVERFHYWSDGKIITWQIYVKGDKVKAKLLTGEEV